MKQITIYDLLPLLRNGWVACNSNGSWRWYKYKPQCRQRFGLWNTEYERNESCFASLTAFNIAPFDGDWKYSLIKVEHSKKKSTDRKDFDDFIEQHGVSPYGFLTEAILKEDFECWKKRRKNDKDTN